MNRLSYAKKILIVALALMVSISVAACGSGGSSSSANSNQKSYKIACLIPGTASYFASSKEGANKAASEYNVDLTYFDAKWDVTTQIQQIEDCCSSGYDMIAVCTVDAKGILPGIKYANKHNVPIMAWSNNVGDNTTSTYKGLVAYVGQDETATGKLGAKIVKELLGNNGGNVVCIEGSAGTFCQQHRRAGFLEGLKGTNIKVIGTHAADWDKDKAMSIAEDVLQSNKKVDCFFCQDDNMAEGVGEVVKNYGKQDDIVIVGIGGSKTGLQAIKDGVIQGDTFLSGVKEGHDAIKVCVKYLNGEKFTRREILKQVRVTKDNVNDFTGEW